LSLDSNQNKKLKLLLNADCEIAVDQGSEDTVSTQRQISSENRDNCNPLPFRDRPVSKSTCVNRITTELPDGTGDCFDQNIFHSLSPCMRACTSQVKNSHERNEKDPAIA